MSMKDKSKYSGLDVLVVIVYGIIFLVVILNACLVHPLSGKAPIVIDYVNSFASILATFWVSIILTWIIYGGIESHLWYWLPPLCFFFWLNRRQRFVFIIFNVLVILLAMASSHLGPFS